MSKFPDPIRCIVVKRDENFRDVGVWTGFGELAYVEKELTDAVNLLQLEAEISSDPDRAFIFACPFQAHQWRDRLVVPWGDDRDARLLRLMQWRVRKVGDFALGQMTEREVSHDSAGRSVDLQAIERYAFQAGVLEGEKRRTALDAMK